MQSNPVAVIMIVAGLLILAFHRFLAKDAIKFQNERLKQKFGSREINATSIVNVVVGAILVVWGIISIVFN